MDQESPSAVIAVKPRSVSHTEKLLNHSQVRSSSVVWQAFDEYAAVLFLEDAIVEEHQQSTVMQRTNQPSESLFEGDYGRRHLILKECVAAFGVDGLYPGRYHRIGGYGEWQAIDDDAT